MSDDRNGCELAVVWAEIRWYTVTAWQRSVGKPVTAYEARWGIPRACSDEMKALASRAADDVALDGQRRAYSSSDGLQATK
jgi:hypothetical protein